jgi:predicted nucleic-acid-binding protein
VIVGLDTSVLVRLLAGDPRDLAMAALRYLLERREAGDRVRVSELVLAESYYALQHHYGASKRDTLAALRQFLSTPQIEGQGNLAALLATPDLESAKPGFVDRLIHSNYLGSGAEQVATFEKAAARLPGVVVLIA